MATQVSCGPAHWMDGMTWSGLLGRTFGCGPSVIDSGTSATALTPAGGVYPAGTGTALQVGAPVSGLSVTVAPGYAFVPSTTAQYGGYKFGLMQKNGTLTVASNSTGSTRQDYVVAYVDDTASSASFCEIEYITGTTSPPSVPASSIILAQVAVPNGASNIIAGDITDQRTFVCAPGGIAYIADAAAAVAAKPSQFFWENDTSQLVQGTGTAGTVSVWTPSSSSVAFDRTASPSSFTVPADAIEIVAEVTITATGSQDFQIDYQIPEFFTAAAGCFAAVGVTIGGNTVDAVYVGNAFIGTTTIPNVSVTAYTNSVQATTPTKGTHTVQLFISTTGSLTCHTPCVLRVTPVTL